MPANAHVTVRNGIIGSLPMAEEHGVLGRCEVVDLAQGAHLCESGQAYEYAWFPLTALISQGSKLPNHSPLNVGLIGNDGMLGATIALGNDTAPLEAVVTGAGTALRMSAAGLRAALHEGDALRQRIDLYLSTMLAQFARTAACNRFHAIGPRLARYLLAATERTSANHIHVTHESLAGMLGVRRSGITIAARALGQQGLIRYARGEITILDRDGLEAAACTCYADGPSRFNKIARN